MMQASSIVADVICNLAKRTPPKIDTLWDREIDTRRAFHLDPTPANLTAWVDAKEALEDAS